jgi:hypothetical protein
MKSLDERCLEAGPDAAIVWEPPTRGHGDYGPGAFWEKPIDPAEAAAWREEIRRTIQKDRDAAPQSARVRRVTRGAA